MTTAKRWWPTIAAFALLIPFKVKADASFTGTADFSMTPQAAIVNEFGYSGPFYNLDPYIGDNTVKINGAAWGAAGAVAGTISNTGGSTYNGDVAALAGESETYNLANLTGSGGSTGPGQDLNVTIYFSYDDNLAAAIFNQVPGGVDSASDVLQIWDNRLPGGSFELLANVLANNVNPGVDGSFEMVLPPNSVTQVELLCTLDGMASSEVEVPEPTTAVLMLLPFGAGLLRKLRRNRTV